MELTDKDNEIVTLNDLFDEYNTNTISVSDFQIVFQGIRIDYIHKEDNGNISIWAGNPDTDKYAEELLPNKIEKRKILELILEHYD